MRTLVIAIGAALSVLWATTMPSAERRVRTKADIQLPPRLLGDACGRQIVLLGESPTHGFGVSMRLKAELVRTMVERCDVDAVFFESGIYDFLKIDADLRSGRAVDPPTLMAAIGLLWNNADVAPLTSFLADRANHRHLMLGGLDDQIGRESYAQRSMAADLVRPLEGDEQRDCLATLRKHTDWQYTAEAPYSESDRSRMLDCLDRIRSKLPHSNTADLAMTDSVARWLARDFPVDAGAGSDAEQFSARDASMFHNFQFLMARLPPRSKIVVWTATVHSARDLSGVPGREGSRSLGSLIAREYGSRVFSIGMSAYSGTFGRIGHPRAELPDPPPASLEANAIVGAHDDLRYLSQPELRKLAVSPSRLMGTAFVAAAWDRIFDGVVVIREERPPSISAFEGTPK
jgi:erythromycin esterase-like protein